MKSIISSSQSGYLEKEFILENRFFYLSWDILIEEFNSSYSVSLENQNINFNLIWTNSSNYSIKESELNLNKWNSIKLIYIPSVGILYYKNDLLINTLNLEITHNFYKLKVSLDYKAKIRNLFLGTEMYYSEIILHSNELNLNNFWSIKGNIESEFTNNSHFGKAIKLLPNSNLSLNPEIYLNDNSDFTFDFYIQSNSNNILSINLFKKIKSKISNLITLKFENKKLVNLILNSSEKLILDSPIDKPTHISLIFYHKLKLLSLFINGIKELSIEFSIAKDNYFLSIINNSGVYYIDELHFCSGLALWINDFKLSKYPYKNNSSGEFKTDKIYLPDEELLQKDFISKTGLIYNIKTKFSILDNENNLTLDKSVILEVIWKLSDDKEFSPYYKNVFKINQNNYFFHKNELIELANLNISACQKFLDNRLGKIELPKNISKYYINKENKSISISVKFDIKFITHEIQIINYKIFYILDSEILFKENNLKITSENYMNYKSELNQLLNKDLSECKSYLDSFSNSKIILGNSEHSLELKKNSILQSDNIKLLNRQIRLNLRRK